MNIICKYLTGIALSIIVPGTTVWAAEPVSIRIDKPKTTTLLAGESMQMSITATYADGSSKVVTESVKWSVSDNRLVTISNTGMITPVEGSSFGMGGPGGGMPPGEGGPGEGMGMPGEGGPGMGGGPGFDGPGPGGPGFGGTTTRSNSGTGQRRRNQQGGPGMFGGPGGGMDMPGGGPGGPGGGMGMPGGGPGGPGGGMGNRNAETTVSVTATLDIIASAPLKLKIKTTEGTAKYTQIGGTAEKTNEVYNTSKTCMSGVKTTDSGTLILKDCKVNTSGNTINMENSSFYGLNAGVLALSSSKIKMSGGSIITTGTGANGAFAVGEGSIVELSDVLIDCKASGAHGVDATIAGTVICKNVDIKTAGNGASAAISTDRGGGTIEFTGGSAYTSGTRSPAIYSTGKITVKDADCGATASEAIVIEGKNSVYLVNTKLSCLKKCGAMLYQSFSGDAGVGTSVLKMEGGAMTAAEGPMFYITNTSAYIEIEQGAKLEAASGILIKAGSDRWGRSGSNGGKVVFKAENEKLAGDIECDKNSRVTAILRKSTILEGKINTDDSADRILLEMDESSSWEVTGKSYLTGLMNDDITLSNIHDNGHDIYYKKEAETNKWLEGKTIALSGGGKLIPY